MYEIVYTNRMKRDAKLMKKRGRNLEKLVEVFEPSCFWKSAAAKIQRPPTDWKSE